MFVKLSLLILLSDCVFGSQLLTSVDTLVGQIHGFAGKDFKMFLGIPYGVVDERDPFGTASPHPYFKIPWQAFNDSTICPQYDKGFIKGTIDCLRLNVYTPNVLNPWPKTPVMVYIHGGAFMQGDGALSSYSPKFLIRHDVIVVTINYRLGPYGHLCLPNSEYSNQALKDQTLALRWVKNNIGSFGGDSENILLFGHSSGSISVELHVLFNNENLFNKVILQSGPAVTPLCNRKTNTETFAKDIGVDSENNIDVDRFVQIISAIDSDEIMNITKNYVFRPCIDGTPKRKNLQNIKIMIGGTMKEMLFFYPRADRTFYDNFDFAAELDLGFSKMADGAVDDLKVKYFNHFKNSSKDSVVNFISDFEFNYPIERAVRYYVKNNCTVYRYLFSYDGGRNYVKIRENISSLGSTHGDELGYLFDMPLFGNITKEDQVIVDRITLLWTNFAKYGNPTPSPSPLLPEKWTPVTARVEPYLTIDQYEHIFDGLFQERMEFWDIFYNKYGKYAKGINLGEKWQRNIENKAFIIDFSKMLLYVSLTLIWQ